MRGILGAGTNRMNIYTIRKANVGFAKYVLGLPEGKNVESQLVMITATCLTNLQLKVRKF